MTTNVCLTIFLNTKYCVKNVNKYKTSNEELLSELITKFYRDEKFPKKICRYF